MKYTLGLDIGVTSVGWAVINNDEQRIEDIGVRIFEKAETHDGKPLSLARREARGTRRRLRRRVQRLVKVRQFFVANNLLSQQAIDIILSTPYDPYEIRARALDEKITNEDLFKAIYHIAKHRGFKSNRKLLEESDAKSEDGRVLTAISTNKALLAEGGYRTAGEALHSHSNFALHKRNRLGNYNNSFGRKEFEQELHAIFEAQLAHGLALSEQKVTELVDAILFQRAFMTQELIDKMVGKCEFEEDQKRAPKASYTFEKFNVLQKLVHVRLAGRKNEGLTPEEIDILLRLAIDQATGVSYAKARIALSLGNKVAFVNAPIKKGVIDESAILVKMPKYHDIRKALKDHSDIWAELLHDDERLDAIAEAFSYHKDEAEIRKALEGVDGFPEDAINAMLKKLNFSGFGHLSVKALAKINKELAKGLVYSAACEAVGYDFKGKKGDLRPKLPGLSKEYFNEITSPVVRRGVAQTIKVINAVIDRYGAPYYINIECSRDLAKNYKDRKLIEKQQKENQSKNEHIVAEIKGRNVIKPNGQDIIKFKLYEEQRGRCLYSDKPIDEERLFEDGYCEIDHIIPYSRCGNDSLNNKVLVVTAENRNKVNQTPFEVFGGNEDRWEQFVANVNALAIDPRKKANFLCTDFKKTDWSERALQDTKHITRFLSNFVKNNLQFAEGLEKERVITPNGSMTAYMRKRWGLGKDRGENVLHHAQDAAVVAVVNKSMIDKVQRFSKQREVVNYLASHKDLTGVVDPDTGEQFTAEFTAEAKEAAQVVLRHKKDPRFHFPPPWEGFVDEVRIRTASTSYEIMQTRLADGGFYDEAFRVNAHPIFVSRMPSRKGTGEAHGATLRSPKMLHEDKSSVRKQVLSLTAADLPNLLCKESDLQLYGQIESRLEAAKGDAKKAFADGLFKKDKVGNDAHQVRTVKVGSVQKSRLEIEQRQTVVDNGDMARVDIFSRKDKKGKLKFYTVPVYIHQIRQCSLPMHAIASKGKITKIDDSFHFHFSLYANDFVRIITAKSQLDGYYRGYDVSGATHKILRHDAASIEKATTQRLGITDALNVQKFSIGILGDSHLITHEKRQVWRPNKSKKK